LAVAGVGGGVGIRVGIGDSDSILDWMSTKTVLSLQWQPKSEGEVRETDSISNDLDAVEKWIARLRKTKHTCVFACGL
jgi:hypothetical protein